MSYVFRSVKRSCSYFLYHLPQKREIAGGIDQSAGKDQICSDLREDGGSLIAKRNGRDAVHYRQGTEPGSVYRVAGDNCTTDPPILDAL